MPRAEPGVALRAGAWLRSGIASFLGAGRYRDEGVTPIERPRRRLMAAGFVLWLIVVGAGLGQLWAYAQRPGPAAHASALWPAATRLVRDTHRPTLLVFAHPQCPCSRATIGELALLMAQAKDRATAYVIFYRPLNEEAGWEQTDLWQSGGSAEVPRGRHGRLPHEADQNLGTARRPRAMGSEAHAGHGSRGCRDCQMNVLGSWFYVLGFVVEDVAVCAALSSARERGTENARMTKNQ